MVDWWSGGAHRECRKATDATCCNEIRLTSRLFYSQDQDGASATEIPVSDGCDGRQLTTGKRLACLINLQQWDGTWNLTEDLGRLTGVSVTEATAAVSGQPTLDKTVLGTVLGMVFIQEKYPAQADVWKAIVAKASVFLAKLPDQTAVAKDTSALLAIVKSK